MKVQKGFSLIELMIVVAIIGIIAGIAYPSYMESVRKSNRADGKATLNDVAHRLQRCFTTYNAYNNANCAVATSLSGSGVITSAEGMYSVTAVMDATSYTLTAAPVGSQTADANCGSLTLTSAGVRNATGSLGADCW